MRTAGRRRRGAAGAGWEGDAWGGGVIVDGEESGAEPRGGGSSHGEGVEERWVGGGRGGEHGRGAGDGWNGGGGVAVGAYLGGRSSARGGDGDGAAVNDGCVETEGLLARVDVVGGFAGTVARAGHAGEGDLGCFERGFCEDALLVNVGDG